MRRLLPALLTLLSGCADPIGAWPWDRGMDAWWDQDGDGFDGAARGGSDCDDQDPGMHPGAVSIREGVAMAAVCPGTFTMGSPAGEVGRGDDEQRHQVTVSRAFEISVYEVSQAQFEQLMVYQPSHWPGCLHCPVESVSWHQAAQYTNALSYEAGLSPCYECTGFGSAVTCATRGEPYGCEGFRLPTEAEWELAARAGTHSAFSNRGELLESESSYCGGGVMLDNGELLDHIAVYCGNDIGMPVEVGLSDPNPWGLFDMHGNVWEWCHDGYTPYEDAALDPWGFETAAERVRRGGSFSSYPHSLRAARRGASAAGQGADTVGFRVARSLDP